MEKFMFIFQSPMSSEQPSPQQMEESMGKWFAWINLLAEAGKYDSGEALLPGGKVLKGNHKNVTDGPFTEGKEIIGGYFIVNAADYNEAVSLCEGYPDYTTGGSVMVRQVQKIDMPA
jgi:hypothetical protein